MMTSSENTVKGAENQTQDLKKIANISHDFTKITHTNHYTTLALNVLLFMFSYGILFYMLYIRLTIFFDGALCCAFLSFLG